MESLAGIERAEQEIRLPMSLASEMSSSPKASLTSLRVRPSGASGRIAPSLARGPPLPGNRYSGFEPQGRCVKWEPSFGAS